MDSLARSPSQTLAWLECPVKRALASRLKLRPRKVLHNEIAAVAGNGFAAGMETWNKNGRDNLDAAIQSCMDVFAHAESEWLKYGREVPDHEQAYLAAAGPRTTTAIKKYCSNDPLNRYVIRDVELVLPNHGNARIDLGIRDEFGLAVVDYKFKLRLDARYRDKVISEYDNSWQQYHYAWAYGEHVGEPIHTYYICLVVAEPKFSVTLHEYPIHPENMEMWKESAERIWRQMDHEDAGLVKPWMAGVHDSRYGPCEFKRACFSHRYDMNLMMASGDYVIVEEVN